MVVHHKSQIIANKYFHLSKSIMKYRDYAIGQALAYPLGSTFVKGIYQLSSLFVIGEVVKFACRFSTGNNFIQTLARIKGLTPITAIAHPDNVIKMAARLSLVALASN